MAKRDRQVQLTADLSDEEIKAVENAEMAQEFENLNSEIATGKHAAR